MGPVVRVFLYDKVRSFIFWPVGGEACLLKLLDKLYKTFEKLGRLIVPEATDWQRAGKIIAKLGRKYGFGKMFLSKITNDILIALSAKRIGAIVVTRNMVDFIRIKEFVDFKIHG